MYTTQGIVLKKIPAGEADATVILYTKDFGKMRVLATGVKKPEAKLKGHVEPFNFVNIQFVLGKYGERLTYCSALTVWPRTRSDLVRGALAAYMAALVDAHCFLGEKDENMWHLLLGTLNAIETKDEIRQKAVDFLYAVETRVLTVLGYEGEEDISTLQTPVARPFVLEYNTLGS